MPVHKRKRSGKVDWYYKFDTPGSTRQERRIIREYGFATMKEAVDAEAKRRIEEQEKDERVEAGSPIAAPLPTTLAMLLKEFFEQHVDKKLAPKTRERYHEQAGMLDPALLKMPLIDIKAMHLNREWNRLLESGGHHRKTKAPRPLSKKTVRNIAGVLPAHSSTPSNPRSSLRIPCLPASLPSRRRVRGSALAWRKRTC